MTAIITGDTTLRIWVGCLADVYRGQVRVRDGAGERGKRARDARGESIR